MNDHAAPPIAGDDWADADAMPTLFFAVVPDAFMDRTERSPFPPAGPSDFEGDEESPLTGRDRWSF